MVNEEDLSVTTDEIQGTQELVSWMSELIERRKTAKTKAKYCKIAAKISVKGDKKTRTTSHKKRRKALMCRAYFDHRNDYIHYSVKSSMAKFDMNVVSGGRIARNLYNHQRMVNREVIMRAADFPQDGSAITSDLGKEDLAQVRGLPETTWADICYDSSIPKGGFKNGQIFVLKGRNGSI